MDESVTAQKLYAEILRTEIGPRLRALGFVGSGSSFVLPDDEWSLVVGFQKNRYSSASEVSYTVNPSKVRKTDWATFREDHPSVARRPSGNTHYFAKSEEMTRLGNLMPPRGFDRWWQVKPDHPNARVSGRVAKAIEQLGIPWLRGNGPDQPRRRAR